jgi:hypothetical protein
MYLRLQAQWIESQKLRVQVTLTSTAWSLWPKGHWLISPHRCVGDLIKHASHWWLFAEVRFALSSSSVFSRTDTVTDSENFYHSILDLLEDPDESEEVVDLMTWWTRFVIDLVINCTLTPWHRRIFPNSSSSQRDVSKNSALSKIREKRAALQARANVNTT